MNQHLQYAVELARAAGKITLEHFGHVNRLTKTHASTTDEAVTEADRAAQRLIVAGLRKRFPDDGIIGEESDSGDSITNVAPRQGQRIWVIDPIDGTNNFIAGLPNYCVCIALLDAAMPVMGVVYDVTRDHMYCAAKGEGAWLDNRRLQAVSTPMNNSALIMLTANCVDKSNRAPGWAIRWLSQTNWKLRVLGSAALEATQVAAGVAHAAVTVNGKLWDIAAPAALILEAGGQLLDLSGKPLFPYRLADYTGAKVPFLACAPAACATLLQEIEMYP
jgi:myo-inositol-1(or 4)-monophosphatase